MGSPTSLFFGTWEIFNSALNAFTVTPAEWRLPWERLTLHQLAAKQSSDTLYVLGSGASVLTYSERDWARIANSNSIGMNLWLAHPFVPTFYSLEAINLAHSDRAEETAAVFRTAMQERALDYKGVLKIITDYSVSRSAYLSSLPQNFLDETAYLTAIRSGVARDEDEVRKLVRTHVRRYPHHASRLRLFKYRASLVMCIYMGYVLGYQRIVLGGVDLSTPDYFYSTSDPYGLLPEGFTTSPKLPHHVTTVNKQTLQSVVTVVSAIYEELLLPNRVRLSTLNPRSPLSEFLPVGH